jgi:hypothetical protein
MAIGVETKKKLGKHLSRCFFVYVGEPPASAEAQRTAKPFVSFGLLISVESN